MKTSRGLSLTRDSIIGTDGCKETLAFSNHHFEPLLFILFEQWSKDQDFKLWSNFFQWQHLAPWQDALGAGPCRGRPSRPATWWGSAAPGSSRALQLLPQAPKDNRSALRHEPSGRSTPEAAWAGGLEVDDCSPTLLPDSFVSICSLATTPEATQSGFGAWGAGIWDKRGTTPPARLDLSSRRVRRLPEGKGVFASVHFAWCPSPTQDSSCSSPATAVLNKNNRHKLSLCSPSYFPLIMAYIYIYKIADFKRQLPRAPS